MLSIVSRLKLSPNARSVNQIDSRWNYSYVSALGLRVSKCAGHGSSSFGSWCAKGECWLDRFSKLMLWVTSLLVCWLGAASIYGSADGQIRQLEQRSPATLPKLSIDSWLSGQYALGVESWLSDRVVLRQSALDAQEWIRSLRGPNLQNERIVAFMVTMPWSRILNPCPRRRLCPV